MAQTRQQVYANKARKQVKPNVKPNVTDTGMEHLRNRDGLEPTSMPQTRTRTERFITHRDGTAPLQPRIVLHPLSTHVRFFHKCRDKVHITDAMVGTKYHYVSATATNHLPTVQANYNFVRKIK